ncbi:MAG: PEP-CTERM sorting domain-containing protein [Candidatus Thiodiazotropha sp. (ex Semelilucina semeliformis)]|nr:PEP-CTERM sorting domain-containing protein [Candidatus Thiodiazotropha sp. (ex Semelilucina semeliformis)]MCU7828621.1 PEP-CTERM sorting domain-containing protein [Candidatus Thiodiazotropha sp. (ex Myrtea sp. 'scaly one' KF741663)]
MKKIVMTALGLVALGFSSISLATPVYSGNTVADFGTNPGNVSDTAAGFYIWSDSSHENWSVRWSGNDFGTKYIYDWFGTIELTSLVDGSVKEVKFEYADSIRSFVDIFDDQDFIAFNGVAGKGWDGFDFSIDTSIAAVVDFELGSSMFSDMVAGPYAQESMAIYIGQDFDAPLVQVQERSGGRIVQRFETVPEPGTLLLMATGLLGMGATRLRHRKS